MTSPAVRNDIQIDRVRSAAICEEMGDHLRIPGWRAQPIATTCIATTYDDAGRTNGAERSRLSRSWRQKRNGSKLINFIQTATDQLAMLPLNQNAEVTK